VIVALDGTPLTMSSGGLRRYTEELTIALRREFPDDEFRAISDQLQPVRGLDRRWWSFGVHRAMRRLKCDLFHGTSFAVPYLPFRPSVMTIHDLSPWMDPSWHHAAGRVRRRTPFLLKLGIATMILTDTEAVRRQVIDRFGMPASRVAAVHLASSRELRRIDTPPPSTPFFLYAGTIEPRKNIPALLNSWRRLRTRHDVDLVLAGRMRDDAPAIAPQQGLRIEGEITDERLAMLYSSAVACVYPTMYEGFGLPVLEAMQCGAPVITSHDPAVLEVSGGAAIHVDGDGIEDAMEMLLTHPALRQRHVEKALRRAAEFSWSKTARGTREVYLEAVRRFHG
jgi:glycosyltransferase involved in cell wall biosynthesis